MHRPWLDGSGRRPRASPSVIADRLLTSLSHVARNRAVPRGCIVFQSAPQTVATVASSRFMGRAPEQQPFRRVNCADFRALLLPSRRGSDAVVAVDVDGARQRAARTLRSRLNYGEDRPPVSTRGGAHGRRTLATAKVWRRAIGSRSGIGNS